MTDILKPRDGKEVVEAVAWAVDEAKTLEVVSRGSKRAIGRAAQESGPGERAVTCRD